MKFLNDLFKPNAFTTGLAMFAMFFGSGNLIFPLGIGQMAGNETPYALIGLFLTAVFLPFFSLCLMLLFQGDYDAFLVRIGKVPGRIVAFIILALIGPFGVLPRCIAFSHSTFSIYFENVSLESFSLISCIIIFLCSVKTNKVVGLIGNFLTPILLFSLAVLIYYGLSMPQNSILIENESKVSMLLKGMVEGYKTFDIFASIFFAAAIIPAFKSVLGTKLQKCPKSTMKLAVKSSLVGMVLLFLVYGGLGIVSGNLSQDLVGISSDKLLGTIANLVMGKNAGIFSNMAVMLACLTTAITLAVVSADFIQKEVFLNKISYFYCLVITMLISYVFACFGFSGIMKFVFPFLVVLCPAIIALVIASFFEKFFNINLLKPSFYSVLLISFIFSML